MQVFNGSGLKNWYYYVIGYGLPVLIVAITLAATQAEAYITHERYDIYSMAS